MKSAVRETIKLRELAAFGVALGVVATASLGALTGKAGAALDDTLLHLGSEVLELPGVTPGEVQTARVNGTNLNYRVESVATPLSEAFSHFARVCGGPHTHSTPLGPLLRALAVRGASSGDHAYVACLDLRRVDLASLVRLAQRVAKTLDLSHLGALRYVYARQDQAEPRHTLLFTMWADGPVDLRSFMLVPGNDPPGVDLLHVPRPRAAHRVLSVEQSSGRLAVYRVRTGTPESQLQWFSERFRSRGWIVTDGARVGAAGPLLVVAERGSRTASVIFSRTDTPSTLVIAHETETL